MDIQKMLDMMSNAARDERKLYHLTIGGLIDALEASKVDFVQLDTGGGIGREHSYRGYYSDLSFEPIDEPAKASDVIKLCKAAAGSIYEGWKGGEYTMDLDTPLWVAYSGCTGRAMISITDDGQTATIQTKQVD